MTEQQQTSDPFDWGAVLGEHDYVKAAPIPEGATFPLDETPSTDVEVSGVLLDSRTADQLLDDLRDPRALVETSRNIRETLIGVVRQRGDERHRDRVERHGDEAITGTSDLRIQVVGAADDEAALRALAGAFSAAADEAKGIAGELLDELPQRVGKPRQSMKLGDGHGFELTVKREARRELSVDHAAIDDVLAAHSIATSGADGPCLERYAEGARDGMAALRSVLASSPAYRSTALDALATQLENADEDALAKRLRAAYARVEKGEPAIKLERKPLETKGEGK